MEWYLILVRVLSTLIISFAFCFGLRNFLRFKNKIWTNRTLFYFYVFALTCLFVLVPQVWTPVNYWYTMYWLVPNSIVKNCEICFAWC